MYVTSCCPACGNTARRCWPALVSEFAQHYIMQVPLETCRLCECLSCALRYFDTRFSEDEMHRLYEGYRGERYLRARRRLEPAYDDAVVEGNPQARKEELESFLRRYLQFDVTGPVLDYGGGDGALVPPIFVGRRYVYDISDAPVAPPAERVGNLRQLDAQPAVVLLSHVLEHLSEPIEGLREIASILSPEGWLYVEVPNQRYRLRWLGPPAFYRRWFNQVAEVRLVAPLVNFAIFHFARRARPGASRTAVEGSTHDRPPGKTFWSFEDLRLHEHISFFCPSALYALMKRAGFSVIHLEADNFKYRLLARRTLP